MSIKCITVVLDADGDEIACLFRNSNGHPMAHGKDLSKFLQSIKIVTTARKSSDKNIAVGPECLMAQLVSQFKAGPGQVYLFAAGTRSLGEEYIYVVHTEEGKTPEVEIYDVCKTSFEPMFSGTAKTLLKTLEEVQQKADSYNE